MPRDWRGASHWDKVKPQKGTIEVDDGNDTNYQSLTEQHVWGVSPHLDLGKSEDIIQYAELNTKFTNEMFGWYETTSPSGDEDDIVTGEGGLLNDPNYSAEQLDSMGLDIVRVMTDTGEKDGNKIKKDDSLFYKTATRGKVDWEFYKESNAFQKAYKEWGTDLDDKEGITSIEEIRALNPTAWKEAKNEGQGADAWKTQWEGKYIPTFKYDEAPKYEPQELSISYNTRRDQIQHPTRRPIQPHSLKLSNIKKVMPTRPSNLPTSFR